jgi:hypothetical protein
LTWGKLIQGKRLKPWKKRWAYNSLKFNRRELIANGNSV